jgi:hypothetical protein
MLAFAPPVGILRTETTSLCSSYLELGLPLSQVPVFGPIAFEGFIANKDHGHEDCTLSSREP